MMSNEISQDDVDLLLAKLHSEKTPLVAFYISKNMKVMMTHAVLAGISSEHGLVVVPEGSPEPHYDYISILMGSPLGTGCKYWYGDKRELPDDDEGKLVASLGESALLIRCPDNGELRLYFT